MNKFLVVFFVVVVLSGCQSRAKEVEKKASDLSSQSKAGYSAAILVAQGQKNLAEGNIKEAVNIFRKAIELDPKMPQPYLSLSEIFMRLGKFPEAQVILEQAIANAPEEGTVFYLLGVAHQQQGKTMPALLAARRSVEIFQKNKDTENFKKSMELVQILASEITTQQVKLAPDAQATLSSQETATIAHPTSEPAEVVTSVEQVQKPKQNFGTR